MCDCPYIDCHDGMAEDPDFSVAAKCHNHGVFRVTRRDYGDDEKVFSFCRDCYKQHVGSMVDRVSGPNPTPFGVDRAQEIWNARGAQWALDLTPGEAAYVHFVWDEIQDGSSSFMTAFLAILNGKVTPWR